MTAWSTIQETALAFHAHIMIDDNGCAYHNLEHVQSMYQYLADTNEPYDKALDWAVLFHDIVYDDKPEKEFRSAKKFVDMVERYGGCNLRPSEQARVYSLIMRTADHVVHPDVLNSSAIIRADLHALTDTVSTIRNFANIMEESCNLYSVDPKTFAEQSQMFMQELRKRVQQNVTLDSKHSEFYKNVLKGIDLTIELGKTVKGVKE